jgi:hypothetical protein
MAISVTHFSHANQSWVVMFESYYINPANGRKRNEADARITWTIRKIVPGGHQMCVSGHWSAAKGAYSIDRMKEHEPAGLIEAGLSKYARAHVIDYNQMTFSGCCRGGPPCADCRAVKLNNKRVRAQIEARVRRLFDASTLTGDEPLPHVYAGSVKGARRERKHGNASPQASAETGREGVE